MKEIITDQEKLQNPSEPLKIIDETGFIKEESLQIISELTEVMQANPTLLALAAPQIGYNKRIFCLRFNDKIKSFINPIINNKNNAKIIVETNASFPGKEFLIARPTEITAVYYNEDFKYEDNKFINIAAELFDQQCQLLDGDLPTELGLMSDIETDGTLANLTEAEFAEVCEIYKQFIKTKTQAYSEVISQDEALSKEYKKLKFSESIINGRTQIIEEGRKLNREQRRAIKFKKKVR